MWHASFLPFHHSFLAAEVFFFSDLFGLCRIPLMPMLSLEGVRLSKSVSVEPEEGGGSGPIFDDGEDSRDAHQGLNQPFPTHKKKKKNSKRFSPETMPQFPPHRHHVPPIKFQTHSPSISPFLPWSKQNKNTPLRPLAKGHTWSLFFFPGRAGGNLPYPRDLESFLLFSAGCRPPCPGPRSR